MYDSFEYVPGWFIVVRGKKEVVWAYYVNVHGYYVNVSAYFVNMSSISECVFTISELMDACFEMMGTCFECVLTNYIPENLRLILTTDQQFYLE